MKAWAEIHLGEDPAAAYRRQAIAVDKGVGEFAAMQPLTKARLQKTIQQSLLLAEELKTVRGEVHAVRECDDRRVRLFHDLKARWLAMPRSLTAALAMQPPETVERILTEQINAMLDELAGDLPAHATTPQTT